MEYARELISLAKANEIRRCDLAERLPLNVCSAKETDDCKNDSRRLSVSSVIIPWLPGDGEDPCFKGMEIVLPPLGFKSWNYTFHAYLPYFLFVENN